MWQGLLPSPRSVLCWGSLSRTGDQAETRKLLSLDNRGVGEMPTSSDSQERKVRQLQSRSPRPWWGLSPTSPIQAILADLTHTLAETAVRKTATSLFPPCDPALPSACPSLHQIPVTSSEHPYSGSMGLFRHWAALASVSDQCALCVCYTSSYSGFQSTSPK